MKHKAEKLIIVKGLKIMLLNNKKVNKPKRRLIRQLADSEMPAIFWP